MSHFTKKYRLLLGLTLFLFASMVYIKPAYAAKGFDQYAKSSDMANQKEVEKYGMVPIYGQDINDGSYQIEVSSSSPFFRVEKAVLNVKDGKMNATITMSSYSYDYVYLGTAKKAAAAKKSDYIKFKEVAGYYTFSFDVPSLNHKFHLAAFSNRKKKWYDRFILFDASSLEDGAVKLDLPDYDKIEKAIDMYDSERSSLDSSESTADSTSSSDNSNSSDDGDSAGSDGQTTALTPASAMAFDADDGEYSIELDMTGGSGRASISSPTLLIVKDGKAYAQLTWSSTYYDYMIVGGKKYLNENSDGGNSTFTIPISAMDKAIPIIGDTTAMDDPVEVEYQITFYSDSIGSKSMIPQEAAKRVLVIGVIIMIIGGVINYFFQRKRKK